MPRPKACRYLETTHDDEMKAKTGKRFIRLLALGATLLICFSAYYRFSLQRPIGQGPAGHSISIHSFQGRWSDKPVLLLGFGDSVTAGFGASKGHSYFERLVKNPENEFSDVKGVCL